MTDENAQGRMETIKSNIDDFLALINATEPMIPDSGLLAGAFRHCVKEVEEQLERRARVGSDNMHFPMNPSFLKFGFAGIAKAAAVPAEGADGEQAEFRNAICAAYTAAAGLVARHAVKASGMAALAESDEKLRLESIARNCEWLSANPPSTFIQAVQLYWFAWRIRHLIGGTSTIGRLDRYLNPFYERDLKHGTITASEATDIICELFLHFNRYGSGDTLMNLMLGGQDSDGIDAGGELSIIMMDAQIRINKTEPHLNIRVHSGSKKEFIDAMLKLQLVGHGQGTVYNDNVVIPALVKHGYSMAAACNYSNDGCSEIVIDGESGIEFVQMEAMKTLELALFNGENVSGRSCSGMLTRFESGDMTGMGSFKEVFEAFMRQFIYQTDQMMDRLSAAIANRNASAVSPAFLAGTFPECAATGKDPFRGGFTEDCFMVFSGSIPTVADSLAAIRKTVFDDGYCSMKEVLDALKADFKGHEELRRKLLSAPKFGNDEDYVDGIAAEIVRRFNERVSSRESPTGFRYMPALFNFQFIQHADSVGATPDGRRWKDPISEHFSPTPGRAKSGPTAVIRSAIKAPLAGACGTSTFFLSLARNTAPANAKGLKVLGGLVSTALKMGIAVMNIAIYDAETLRKAKANPEAYEDLIVRVWGYSARFVTLTDEMQNHIIARIIGGK